MKRPDKPDAASGSPGSLAGEDAILRKCPTILMYMCDTKYDDGAEREPSALSICIRDGEVLLALNDKDAKQSIYTQAGTLSDALKLMEAALRDGKATWRPWKSGKKK